MSVSFFLVNLVTSQRLKYYTFYVTHTHTRPWVWILSECLVMCTMLQLLHIDPYSSARCRHHHHKVHRLHINCIYGFDDVRKLFLSCTFFRASQSVAKTKFCFSSMTMMMIERCRKKILQETISIKKELQNSIIYISSCVSVVCVITRDNTFQFVSLADFQFNGFFVPRCWR